MVRAGAEAASSRDRSSLPLKRARGSVKRPPARLDVDQMVAPAARHSAAMRRANAGVVRRIRLRRGSWVIRRGQRPAGVYAVVEGMVKLAVRGPGDTERVLRFVGPGDSFGEASVLLGRRSPVDALTIADTVLAVTNPRSVHSRMRRDTRFACAMARLIAERELALLAEFEAITLHPARARLAWYLLTLAVPSTGGRPWHAPLPAMKTLVASRLGVKKETFSRLLHDLAIRQWIEVFRAEIMILKPERLIELAQGLPCVDKKAPGSLYRSKRMESAADRAS